GSDYDTVLSVYDSLTTAPTTITCNDDTSPTNTNSRVGFKFPAVGSVLVAVDAKANSAGILNMTFGYEPVLEGYEFLTNRYFALTSSIAPPLSYQLQATTNLSLTTSAWSNVFVTNFTTTNFPRLRFTDTNAPQYNGRYYRIIPGIQ